MEQQASVLLTTWQHVKFTLEPPGKGSSSVETVDRLLYNTLEGAVAWLALLQDTAWIKLSLGPLALGWEGRVECYPFRTFRAQGIGEIYATK